MRCFLIQPTLILNHAFLFFGNPHSIVLLAIIVYKQTYLDPILISVRAGIEPFVRSAGTPG